ncbi:MAG TPA: MATE family efflux transporter [Ruminococcaceae bacterium]|nr:MATE family efflux transporter [Oscillospiraceae bacterium]
MNKTTKEKSGNFFAVLPVIVSLAWPTVLEEVMQTAVQYIDTAMVGSLGKQATAAVGSTGTVSWLVGSTVSAIGVGFLAYISQAMGAGQKDKAEKASGQAVMSVIAVGILFTALTTALSGAIPVWMQVDVSIREMASRYFLILYSPMLFRTASIIFGTVLRSVGDTKSPMIAGIFVNVINVILNFFLIYPTRNVSLFGNDFIIFGAGWGIDGAAAASAAAYTVGGIIITVTFWKHKTISPKGQKFRPDMAILKPCLKVAIPNMLQRFATSLGYVAFASMINSLGETATAAHTIANTVESAFYIPGYGMQTAAATLSGNACGAVDKKRLSELAKITITLVVVLMILSGGLLFLFAPQLMGLFSKDDDVIRLGTAVLRMVAVSEPFYGVPIVVEGIMQGAGKTVTPFIFNLLGMWCVRIVGTFICTQLLGLGLIAAWGCMIGHNILLFILFIVHYATGRWKPEYMRTSQDRKQ